MRTDRTRGKSRSGPKSVYYLEHSVKGMFCLVQMLQYDLSISGATTETPRHSRTTQSFLLSPASRHAPSTILLCCMFPGLNTTMANSLAESNASDIARPSPDSLYLPIALVHTSKSSKGKKLKSAPDSR